MKLVGHSAEPTSDIQARQGSDTSRDKTDPGPSLPAIIVLRAIILLVVLNLSDRLGLLPERFGSIDFTLFFNVLTVSLAILYLVLWRSWRAVRPQLYFQIAADLVLSTILVASTHGIEGPFVSFYLLIIIYCSLTLGKNGGIISAALSAICYSIVIAATHTGIIDLQNASSNVLLDVFKIGSHVLSFGAVAYLGTCISRRLHVMERVLDEKNESLARLRRLNDHIVSGIRSGLITTDLDGQVTVFNTAAGEMIGKEPNKALGSSVCEIIGENFWELICKTELLTSAQPLRHEKWIRHSNGSMRFLGFSVSPLLDTSCTQLGYIISFQDISEIVRLEREVRFKDRLSAVGSMAAVIAHEIRNPLTAMRGSVEILRTRANLPEKDDRLLNILVSESDRLDSIIEDFLNFAKPKPKPKTVLDLVPVLRDSVALMKNSPKIRGKYSVNLDLEVSDMFVFGNADQIRQIFWNVTQNATRAMPEGGSLTIRAAGARNDTGLVTFTDTGIGMTPEEIEQIFQPFYSGFSKGLGLGLSVVFQIMEDHRGKVWFESEKGKGTKVTLAFPLGSAAPAGSNSAHAGALLQ